MLLVKLGEGDIGLIPVVYLLRFQPQRGSGVIKRCLKRNNNSRAAGFYQLLINQRNQTDRCCCSVSGFILNSLNSDSAGESPHLSFTGNSDEEN